MKDLYKLEDVVKDILINFKDTRYDDYLLINRVYMLIDENSVIRKPFFEIMLNHKELGLPSFKSIERCRRKIFEKHPELKPKKVTEFRKQKEEEYIEYSRR